MAFTPDIGPIGTPDFTSASRGTGPNRAFEALFSGIAETASNVSEINQKRTEMNIDDEARSMFDQVNEEFGVAPPAAMTSELDRMTALQAAFEQGKISEVNYYGRLATLSKKMRAKYPRYEDVVDRTIQSVTGTRPANAYRDALFSEMNSLAQSATDEQKFRRQYEKENEAEIAEVFGEDYFANPSAYDFSVVRQKVSRQKAEKEGIRSEMQRLDLLSKQGQVNEREATRTLSRFMSFSVEAELNKAIGAEGQNFNQILSEFMEAGAQDLDSFTLQIGQVENGLRQTLMTVGQREFVTKGIATQEQVNKAIEDAMYPVTKAKEAILGGDFKYASRLALLNKNITDRNLNDIFRRSGTAQVGSGLSELNRDLGAEYLNEQMRPGGELSTTVDTLAKEATGRALAGSQTDILKSIVESGDQDLARTTLDSFFDVIRRDEIRGPKMKNLVDQLFGPNAIDFMSPDVVNPEDLETLYMKFLDPAVTKAIQERGTPEDMDTYAKWAMEKFLAIPAFRAVAGNAKSIADLQRGEVTYDPGTNRIVIRGRTDDNIQRLLGENFQPYRRAVNAMNKALAVLDPIAEASGIDGKEMIFDLLGNLSLTEGGDGFFKMVEDAIRTSEEGEGEEIPEEEGDESEIDFQFEQEDYDPLEEFPDLEPSASLGEQKDFIKSMKAAYDGEVPTVAQAGLAPTRGRGLANLIPSTARGYNPDIENLRPNLRSAVQKLQTEFGKELPIVSGYRSPTRNRRAGGAKRSQHMSGNAVDIDTRGWSREERVKFIQAAREAGFGGVGVYPNSIHIDMGKTRAWGPNYKNNSLPSWARAVL